MASVTHIDIEVRPSIGYQTVGYTARVIFEIPVEPVEAAVKASEVRAILQEKALEDLDALVAIRKDREGTIAPPAQHAPATVVSQATGLVWATANKPDGRGQFRYVTTASIPSPQFKDMVREQLADLGINGDDVDVFDDRVGNYGLESGNEAYTAGKIKVKEGTKLHSAMQGKAIVGGADFLPSGEVKVSLSKDGKAALQALSIAAALSQK